MHITYMRLLLLCGNERLIDICTLYYDYLPSKFFKRKLFPNLFEPYSSYPEAILKLIASVKKILPLFRVNPLKLFYYIIYQIQTR